MQLNPGEGGNPRGKGAPAAHRKAAQLSSAEGQCESQAFPRGQQDAGMSQPSCEFLWDKPGAMSEVDCAKERTSSPKSM